MGSARSIAALVSGLCLVILGGIGTVVVFLGALVDIVSWTMVSWLLPIAFIAGIGLSTYGLVGVLGALDETVRHGGISGLTDDLDTRMLRRLID